MLVSAYGFVQSEMRNDFPLITRDSLFVRHPEDSPGNWRGYLKDHYAGGKILVPRHSNDVDMFLSQLDLSTFITESNDMFVDMALEEPWLYVRYVIYTQKSNGLVPGEIHNLTQTELFKKFFRSVLAHPKEEVFEINEAAVKAYVRKQGYNSDFVPSLHPEMKWWDPTRIDSQIKYSKR
jgi:hypothetical protein